MSLDAAISGVVQMLWHAGVIWTFLECAKTLKFLPSVPRLSFVVFCSGGDAVSDAAVPAWLCQDRTAAGNRPSAAEIVQLSSVLRVILVITHRTGHVTRSSCSVHVRAAHAGQWDAPLYLEVFLLARLAKS